MKGSRAQATILAQASLHNRMVNTNSDNGNVEEHMGRYRLLITFQFWSWVVVYKCLSHYEKKGKGEGGVEERKEREGRRYRKRTELSPMHLCCFLQP